MNPDYTSQQKKIYSDYSNKSSEFLNKALDEKKYVDGVLKIIEEILIERGISQSKTRDQEITSHYDKKHQKIYSEYKLKSSEFLETVLKQRKLDKEVLVIIEDIINERITFLKKIDSAKNIGKSILDQEKPTDEPTANYSEFENKPNMELFATYKLDIKHNGNYLSDSERGVLYSVLDKRTLQFYEDIKSRRILKAFNGEFSHFASLFRPRNFEFIQLPELSPIIFSFTFKDLGEIKIVKRIINQFLILLGLGFMLIFPIVGLFSTYKLSWIAILFLLITSIVFISFLIGSILRLVHYYGIILTKEMLLLKTNNGRYLYKANIKDIEKVFFFIEIEPENTMGIEINKYLKQYVAVLTKDELLLLKFDESKWGHSNVEPASILTEGLIYHLKVLNDKIIFEFNWQLEKI